jgi:hypothetical protein
MPTIVALHGKSGVFSVNGVTVRLSQISVNITNSVVEYATTGQTPDADSQYWMENISGLNSATIEANGYVDNNATPANRLIGDNIKFRPGTGAAGTVSVAFAANHGFTATATVADIGQAMDAEGNKPDTFKVTLKVSGALTYVNA